MTHEVQASRTFRARLSADLLVFVFIAVVAGIAAVAYYYGHTRGVTEGRRLEVEALQRAVYGDEGNDSTWHFDE